MDFHYRHCFHPAGHGTFFSGHIRSPHSSDFVWVYDCGSKRRAHLNGLVRDFQKTLSSNGGATSNSIDLLCLSHFDSDHVSGLDLLFRAGFHVKTLALPYAHLHDRLRQASDLNEDAVANAGEVAALLLDPVNYLAMRGHLDRIDQIVVIRGGNSDDEEGVPEEEPQSPDYREFRSDTRNDAYPKALRIPQGNSISPIQDYVHAESRESLKLQIVSASRAWLVGNLYELVFYNTVQPNDQAPISGINLEQVAKDVRKLVADFRLTDPVAAEPGWLNALKALYGTHFGTHYQQRNAISLCVHGRRIPGKDIAHCSIFNDENALALGVLDAHRTGILLTGDIFLNRKELLAIRKHLGPKRWDSLALVQIPHHGSRNNWQPGNSNELGRVHNVICAPGTKHHPHDDVLADLPGWALADYQMPVTFNYHHA